MKQKRKARTSAQPSEICVPRLRQKRLAVKGCLSIAQAVVHCGEQQRTRGSKSFHRRGQGTPLYAWRHPEPISRAPRRAVLLDSIPAARGEPCYITGICTMSSSSFVVTQSVSRSLRLDGASRDLVEPLVRKARRASRARCERVLGKASSWRCASDGQS